MRLDKDNSLVPSAMENCFFFSEIFLLFMWKHAAPTCKTSKHCSPGCGIFGVAQTLLSWLLIHFTHYSGRTTDPKPCLSKFPKLLERPFWESRPTFTLWNRWLDQMPCIGHFENNLWVRNTLGPGKMRCSKGNGLSQVRLITEVNMYSFNPAQPIY